MALNVLVVATKSVPRIKTTLRAVLAPEDQVEIGGAERIHEPVRWDLVVVWEPCGWSPFAEPVAGSGIPCFPLGKALVFHPFHAAFVQDVKQRGGRLLPASDPEEIAVSLAAVRAGQSLASTRLLVVDGNEDNARAEQIRRFSESCRARWGLQVQRRPVEELLALAGEFAEAEVTSEWERWLAELIVDRGEMSEPHMRQVVRLYLAQRAMLEESGAQGITVDDIGAFLLRSKPLVMPNATYGPLTGAGYLCCEEGDIEALVTEAVLRAGLGAHPTMSNLYLAYRDAMDALEEGELYGPEHERRDYRQCLEDNQLVAAHFSTSGVLPPNMMEEKRYRVRETLPSWPGQSMTASTPRLGPVVLARLSTDLTRIHLLSGEVAARSLDERRGWYRGRWMIRIPSVKSFVIHCLHQHYAIGPENGNSRVLDTFTRCVLGLERRDEVNFRPGGYQF